MGGELRIRGADSDTGGPYIFFGILFFELHGRSPERNRLPEDMRARLARIAMLIEQKGLEHMGEPHVKHIEGRLWESDEGGERNHTGSLRNGREPACCDFKGFHQENRKDAAP